MTGPDRLGRIEMILASMSKGLREAQKTLAGYEASPPRRRPPPPTRWADRATKKDWNGLVDWVDNLVADYSIRGNDFLPPCWPAHPGVVEELAACWQAWRLAVITQTMSPSGTAEFAAWHRWWLWPMLDRLRTTGAYDVSDCRSSPDKTHVTSSLVRRLADRTYMPTPVEPDDEAPPEEPPDDGTPDDVPEDTDTDE